MSKSMMFEIRNAGFNNKGAELMLMAVLEQVRRGYPASDVAMIPMRLAPYIKRAKLGLYQKAGFYRYRTHWGFLSHLIPKKVLSLFGMVRENEIDVVLDVSGFSYSDQWGTGSTAEAAKSTLRWKKKGISVIFLPQAFGPFLSKKNKNNFKVIADNADLVFARDEVSYQYITDVVGYRSNIKIAPDFTNLVKGVVSDDFDQGRNRFCVVPNYRMIDKTSAVMSSQYLQFLVNCVKRLDMLGAKPFFLIHDRENDEIMARNVLDICGVEMDLVTETDPLIIKGIIGICDGMIGSRFHGLVSALSQGVPSLATGWSHKYQMLFQDYDFPEGLVSSDMPESKLFDMIDLIVDDKIHGNIRKKIMDAGVVQKELSVKMWNDVFYVIDGRG